jgi:hypothetical protein
MSTYIASVWQQRRTPYIYYNLFILFIYLIDQKKVFGEPRCGSGGGVRARMVERWQWRRRRPTQKRRWRRLARAALTAVEETGRVESGRDLESFRIKSETTCGRLLFIGLKISATILN